jgi:hypothetical protein
LHEVEERVKAEILAKLAKLGKELPPDTDPLDIPLLDSDFSSDADSRYVVLHSKKCVVFVFSEN